MTERPCGCKDGELTEEGFQRRMVFGAIFDASEIKTREQIARYTGLSEFCVGKHVDALVKLGRVRARDDGTFERILPWQSHT